MGIRAFKYRIYPNKFVTEKLEWTLEQCRQLYNAALSDRAASYRSARVVPVDGDGNKIDFFTYALLPWTEYTPIRIDSEAPPVSVGKYEQSRKLTIIKRELRPEWQEASSAHMLGESLDRADKAYQNFFRRCKEGYVGKDAGYPNFKGKKNYNSFKYPDASGWELETFADRPKRAKLNLSRIGEIKVHYHRPHEGKIANCIIERDRDEWYCVLVCKEDEVTTSDPYSPLSSEDVGIDVGLKSFAALSDGTFIENPRFLRQSEERLKILQKALSGKQKGSKRWRKKRKEIGNLYRRIRNQRWDFHHKESRRLVSLFQIIAFEKLAIKNMVRRPKPKQNELTGRYLPNGASAKSGLNKSIHDAGWGGFIHMVIYKAKRAGRDVRLVPPKNTSQMCSGCGLFPCAHCGHQHAKAVKECVSCKKQRSKDLKERWHVCACGCELDRDVNAAKNILALGLSLDRNSDEEAEDMPQREDACLEEVVIEPPQSRLPWSGVTRSKRSTPVIPYVQLSLW